MQPGQPLGAASRSAAAAAACCGPLPGPPPHISSTRPCRPAIILGFKGLGATCCLVSLQVVGWRNVFSAGDVTDVKEEKTAGMAGLSGRFSRGAACGGMLGPPTAVCCAVKNSTGQRWKKYQPDSKYIILACHPETLPPTLKPARLHACRSLVPAAGVAARNIRALDQGKELQRYPECEPHRVGVSATADSRAWMHRLASIEICSSSAIAPAQPSSYHHHHHPSLCRLCGRRRGRACGRRLYPGLQGGCVPDWQ